MKKITGGKKGSWLAKGQVIASFEIPKIQAAESQLYLCLFYFIFCSKFCCQLSELYTDYHILYNLC